MNDLMKTVFNLTLAMAKAEEWPDDENVPPLLEDEIAEILSQHRGEEILVYFNQESPIKFRYNIYDNDKYIVFAIYDALENHFLVTVGGTNIVDL